MNYRSIITAAEKALSRERFALTAMAEYGVTRKGLGLSEEPPICRTLETIIEAAIGGDLDVIKVLIEDIDIPQVKEELLQLVEKIVALESHWPKWPEIPEIEIKFKPHVFDDGSKGLIADPPAEIDLGVLGVWEIGEIPLREIEGISLEEQKTEIRAEAQHAFNRLLLRIAAVALVKRGDGLAPMEIWYKGALENSKKNEGE